MSSAIKKALGLADTATDAEVEAAITKNAADAAAATKATAVLKAKSDMTDKEKAFMDGKDDDAVCKFMAQTPTQRADEIAKAAAGDESIVIEGQTIRKSAVGDSMFAIMKAQAKRIDDNEAAIAKAAETAANATFTKLATEKFPTLVGSVDERASVLKFLSTAPEDVRKAADAILAAAEATAKLAFSKLGTLATDEDGAIIEKDDSKPEVTKSGAKLEKLAKDLAAKETGLTFAKAYDRVALEHPELYEKALAGE
jgi:hypothetical protein